MKRMLVRSVRPLLSTALLAVSVLATEPARAQTTPRANATEGTELLNETGRKAFEQRNYAAAYRDFAEAYRRAPLARYAKNLGMAELRLGRYLDAIAHFRRYIRSSEATPEFVDKLRPQLAEALSHVGHVSVRAPGGVVVAVDGAFPADALGAKAVTPLVDPLDVQPGKHTIEGHYKGKVANAAIEVKAGETVEAVLDFPAQESAPGVGVSPEAAPTPSAGAPKDPLPPPPAETPGSTWTTGRIVGASAVGAGLVLEGVALVFLLKANGKASDLNDLRGNAPNPDSNCADQSPPTCSQRTDLANSRADASNLALGFGLAGGAALLGGGILYFLSPPTKEPTAVVQVRPLVGPSSFHLRVTF